MDNIKAKIQELLPDMVPNAKYMGMLTITLSVVLRAVWKERPILMLASLIHDKPDMVAVRKDFSELITLWNLKHDNYDAQSQETKAFIGSLLGV